MSKKPSTHRSLKRKADLLIGLRLLNNARSFDEMAQVDIALPARLALHNLIGNTYDPDDVYYTYTAIRVCQEVLGKEDDALQQLCHKAHHVITMLHDVCKQTGQRQPLGLQEQEALISVIEIYEGILPMMSPNQMVATLEKIKSTMKTEASL